MISLVLFSLLLVTVTPIPIIYSLVGFLTDIKNWKRYYWILMLFIFTISYSYHPTGHSDLVRYVAWIEAAKDYNYSAYIDFMGDNLYVSNFLFWIAGRLGMPYLVPAFTTTVVYGVTTYITCDYAEKHDSKHLIVYVLLIQFLLLPYVTIINNVRNVFAFALIILAAYRDLYYKKRDLVTLLLYILPIFVHKTSFVLILIRILAILAGKYILLSLVVALLVPSILSISFPYVSQISSYGAIGKIIGDALLTGYRAMISTSSWAITVMTGKYYLMNRYFSYFISGILLILSSGVVRKIKFKENIYKSHYFYFLSLICVITIGTNVFRTPVYWRFFAAVVIASGPILLMMLKEQLFRQIKPYQIWLSFMVYGLFFLVLQFYGNSHDINYKEWFVSLMTNPIIRIFIEFVIGIFRV